MNTTTNYGLKMPSLTDSALITVLDDNFNIIDDALLNVYEIANGTANNIILTNLKLVNGCPKNFICSLNNGGSATTVNGIPLYKVASTNAPILIAQKQYTIIYNASGNCFFIKASAEGTSIASNVLAGTTFSNDNDVGILGTMINNNIPITNLAINGVYTIPIGFHPGTERVTQSVTAKGSANYNPSTSTQTISSGQYLSGTQTIAAVTGTATDVDVVLGKTYNSSAGILRTGNASIESLGGKKYASGTTGNFIDPDSITINLPFTPQIVIVTYWKSGSGESNTPYHSMTWNSPSTYISPFMPYNGNVTAYKSCFGNNNLTISGNSFTYTENVASAFGYMTWEAIG